MDDSVVINGIEWSNSTGAIGLTNGNAIITHYYKKDIAQIPFITGINFNDDIWDFTQYDSLHREKHELKFNFIKINLKFKDHIKKMII